MKIGFYLAHPAHYHMFKHLIPLLREKHEVFVAYNKKDVLEDLIESSGFSDICHRINAPRVSSNKVGLLWQFISKIIGAFLLFYRKQPNVVIGTPILISLTGKLLGFKSIIINEDDFDVIGKSTNLGYPYANHILAPEVCHAGKFQSKTVKYSGYHELAYLHPDYFSPDKNRVQNLFKEKPYFILRFAELTAHHDDGKRGIDKGLAFKLIEALSPEGRVYITSEKKLEKEFEPYRISIAPQDIHHALYYANMYIGDSQTMAAEAAVLGTPSLRYNDFVGKLGYLEELEHKYQLTYGVPTDNPDLLIQKVKELLTTPNLKEVWKERRTAMLESTVDVTKMWLWFIDNYPESAQKCLNNMEWQDEFKNVHFTLNV